MSISDLIPKQWIGDYRLLSLLGQGNYSEVYLCEDSSKGERVAVKLLNPQLDEREVKRFLTQAAILNKLDHPSIVSVYDFGLDEHDTPYMVMSYVPHGTLRQRYPRGSRLPLAAVVSYVSQAASALQYVHEHQLVHRDVKPQNMLLDANDQIVLSDFGTATISYSLIPNSVDFEGTVLYAAPEQLKGCSLRSSDQYGLAVMTYELVTGSWPFIGTFEDVTRKHLFEQPPMLREKGIDVSMAVEDVLQRALAKDAFRRFACIQDFAEALSEACVLDEALKQRQRPGVSPKGQFRSPLPFRSRAYEA